jgi:uncharacterized protein (DUF1501 family)
MVSATSTLPLFLQRSALALENPLEIGATKSRPGVPDDRILVVVQLGGGNDGLNTLVPHGQSEYYRARPQLAIRADNVLKFKADADGLGLHPSLRPLMELYDDGLLAVVQGVGYPNPNRSHFKSMDIWHTASPETGGQGTGWIGRYFDNTCHGEPEPNLCISIGDQAPLATQGSKVKPIAFEDENLFRWVGGELHPDLARAYDQINRQGVVGDVDAQSPAAFLMRTALDAQVSSDRIREAMRKGNAVSYPGGRLAESLKMVAAMIGAGLETRVYYATMGGFDTHAGQLGRHAQLLAQFAGAVKAFRRDLARQGNADRVCVMTFSEFGRRVKQNASAGTDHGTAAPMFIIGDMVKPGVHGKHPSLTQLDRHGDLVHNVDFRCVYASVIGQWMGADPKAVLGRPFAQAPIFDGRKVG